MALAQNQTKERIQLQGGCTITWNQQDDTVQVAPHVNGPVIRTEKVHLPTRDAFEGYCEALADGLRVQFLCANKNGSVLTFELV